MLDTTTLPVTTTSRANVLPFPQRPSDGDPALLAVAEHDAAVRELRKCERRYKTLQARLPEEITRKPRVQIGRCHRADGSFDPIYAHSAAEIEREMKERAQLRVDLMSGYVSTAGRTGKIRLKKAPLSDAQRKRQAELRTACRRHIMELTDRLAADRDSLLPAQERAGWSAVKNSYHASIGRLSEARHALCRARPTTAAGALALLETVQRVGRAPQGSEEAKLYRWGQGDIGRNVAAYLRASLPGGAPAGRRRMTA